jgi:oxygen-independent coproporphyrinogen-3 oxidase
MIHPYSLYLHIPFCIHRCAYCDFNTYAGQEEMIPAYVEALVREIDFVGNQFTNHQSTNHQIPVHTIFFGGGTPSLLSPKQFEAILRCIRANFALTNETEITIEANPGTCSFAQLVDLRSLGINRISYGVQSANTEELHMLERIHNFFDVIEAVTSARQAGFDNLNLDLIYGLPEQTLETWQTTVKRILDLHPEHISAYALTLEHGTPFGRWAARGFLPLPDPDLAAEMYEWAGAMFETNGYVQYEISNWARNRASSGAERRRDVNVHPAFACRHNLQYWRGLPYLAFGAGAHGYAHGYRYSNVLRIRTYIDRLTNPQLTSHQFTNHQSTNSQSANYHVPLSPATVNHHRQSLHDDMSEFMMTGLRLTQEGIRLDEFQTRFGQSMNDVYEKEIQGLLKLELIEWVEDNSFLGGEGKGLKIRLTKRGRLLGNQVFMQFI